MSDQCHFGTSVDLPRAIEFAFMYIKAASKRAGGDSYIESVVGIDEDI